MFRGSEAVVKLSLFADEEDVNEEEHNTEDEGRSESGLQPLAHGWRGSHKLVYKQGVRRTKELKFTNVFLNPEDAGNHAGRQLSYGMPLSGDHGGIHAGWRSVGQVGGIRSEMVKQPHATSLGIRGRRVSRGIITRLSFICMSVDRISK